MAVRPRFPRLHTLGLLVLGLISSVTALATAHASAPVVDPDPAGLATRTKPAPRLNCGLCHDTSNKLRKSAHAAIACDSCHDHHNTYPHRAGVPKPSCGGCHPGQASDWAGGVHGLARAAGNENTPDCSVCHGSAHELLPTKAEAFRKAVPDTCGMCHDTVVAQYRDSVHGKALARGVTQAPLCTDCHGEHRIIKHTNAGSPVNTAGIRLACAGCHSNVLLNRKFGMPSDRIVTFDASYHGLAAKGGSQSVANCASCHGVHNILPSSDPRSTINPKNLPKTCGQCHPGAGQRFGISRVHATTDATEAWQIHYIRVIYISIICLTIGLMLLHQGGDWVRKVIRLRFASGDASADFPPALIPEQLDASADSLPATRTGGRSGELRMLPFERIQHAVLAISFVVLAWSGFALRYPDQWWAHPLLLMEGVRPVRSVVHRIAAVVFMALSATHLVSLAANRGLREHWKQLLPNSRDPREAVSNFCYNLGLLAKPPGRSSHSYIEKAEYWAVLWGTMVMVLSGVPLWANNLVMRLLPRIWLDAATAIHFYEAILATLAVVVWHFYSVIFDPDVYPLNSAFLTGRSVKNPEADMHS